MPSPNVELARTVHPAPIHASYPDGCLVGVCPSEIVGAVLGNMSVVDAILYTSTSSCNYKLVHSYVKEQLFAVLRQFVRYPATFLSNILQMKSVVLGSVALKFFEGRTEWDP
ncbi:hypothetical protein SERLA73DRAFT_173995 [Serpula lacrymans var. lacrymans S7.3]|uniref:Uncharacterized protein n=2 Tax=Serpula lacrymans var. lacrymans TaxID=341189 RepID=F8PH11_SERL3|nr:uncharacterized protein SERLADRAFT_454992 [Serpula lacrymans var. lacrymans S7.9]EGO04907.1 hypothetical protein SERLA73DRAFT_173995 [Serpula lacrymans var. lacrymans S7.3]EGO30717.1 hypothetical protein SERLADRAFT_454992 [Serpula lacrymans var. lacrymans S7.9]